MQIKTHQININLFITLLFLVCGSTLTSDLYLPALTSVMRVFNTTQNIIQFTLVSYMAGFACSVLIAGILSDFFDKKNIIIYGLVLQLLATIGCLLSPNIYLFILFRFLQALGGCAGTVLSRSIVREHASAIETVKVLSLFSAGLAIALAIAPIFGGILQKYFGWQGCFWFIILLNIITVFLSIIYLPKDLNVAPIKLKAIALGYIACLHNRTFMSYTIIIGFALGGYFSFISSSAFVFMEKYHLTAVSFGYAYAFVILSYILGSTLARKYANKYSPAKMVHLSAIIVSISALLMSIFLFTNNNLLLYLTSFIIFNFAVGIIMPNCQVGALESIKQNLGTAAGLFYFIEIGIAATFGYVLSIFTDLMQGGCILAISSAGVIYFFAKKVYSSNKGRLKIGINA